MTRSSRTGLPALDAVAMATVLETHAPRWGWDERYCSTIVGKLRRGSPQIDPLEQHAQATIVSMCREGRGLYHALKHAGITQRRYFAWIAKAHTADPDSEPYRQFRVELRAAFEERGATSGHCNPDELSQVVP